MKGVLLLLLTLSLAVSELSYDDDILVFTDKNADEMFEEYNPVLLQFDAPWCGQCRKIDKEYTKAARILGELDDPLYLAKVDSSENPALVEKYSIRQFPTILFIRNGIAVEYKWGLKADDFVEFMKEKAGPVAVTYKTLKELKEALKSSDFAVVGYFKSTKCEEYKQWENEIIHLGVEHAVYITSPSIAEAMGAKMPSIVFYYEGKDPVTVEAKASELRQWMLVSKLPPIVPFSGFYSRILASPENTVHTQLLAFAPVELPEELKAALEAVAEEFKGKLFVVHISPEQSRLFDFFGVSKEAMPSVMMLDTRAGGKKALLREEPSQEVLREFVLSFFEESFIPYWKSEAVPRSQERAVQVLVGQSFEEVAYDPAKNVAVLLYTSWSREAEELQRVYEKLAEDVEDVVFAKMDVVGNEVEDVVVHKLPTLMLFKAGGSGKERVELEGARSLKEMKAFVEEHRVEVADEEEL